MKNKTLILLIIALLILALSLTMVACDDVSKNDSDNGSESGEEIDTGTASGLTNYNVFVGSSNASNWHADEFDARIDGVWDSEVLPKIFPTKAVVEQGSCEVTGIQTSFFAENRRVFTNYHYDIGKYNSSGKKVIEYYQLEFTGGVAHFNNLVAALETNGMFCEAMRNMDGSTPQEGDYLQLHAYSENFYIYGNCIPTISYSESGFIASETFDCVFSIVPSQFDRWNSFNGIALPDFGLLMDEEGYISGYNTDDYVYVYLNKGETLPEYFGLEYGLRATTEAQVDVYVESLETNGCTQTSEKWIGNGSDEGRYAYYLSKDNLFIYIYGNGDESTIMITNNQDYWG